MPVDLLMGTVLGFLTGLGVGGGSLLMLWLTLGLGLEQDTAQAVNLMFFLPSALVACCFRYRQGCLKLRGLLLPAAAGALCAVVFSLLRPVLDPGPLQKAFGLLLLFTGLRELLYRPKQQ